MRLVDVVIPVYEGLKETIVCMNSVQRTVKDSWARIIIVNDCSPDRQITDYLRNLAQEHPEFVLLENEKNLGFVASVNRGMSYDKDRDVLLLNSDVEVAGNWLERLRNAAYHHDNVGSITPFSNNATICSFPNICKDNQLLFNLSLEQIDEQFAAEFTVGDAFQVPTGVGCCIYLRRDALDKVGLFDLESFGRGYGEENDWCQRAIRAGFRNLHLANCFIYHKGSVSFGAEHSPRLTQALDTLDRKYPRYHADIQRYIARDPARVARVRAWLRLFSVQDTPKILMISHKLGGGVQQHVDEIASRYANRVLFLFMMPDVEGESVRISSFDGNDWLRDGLFFHVESEYEKLIELLRGLGVGRIHFHHTIGLPTRLWGLGADLRCDYDLTIHDYYLVNGNPSLTDIDGRYVDESAPDFDQRCAGHRPLPSGVDAKQWRENQKMLIEGANRIIFPSIDSKQRFTKYFKVKNSVVSWHPDYLSSAPYPEPSWQFPRTRPLRVLALGALSKEKGADVLESVAASLVAEDIEFHLLGYAYRKLGHQVHAHEPYNNENVHALIRRINPDLVWFPAMWPETYSYTLSIALQQGLPVVVPNIGAFVERVHGRPNSVVVKWNSTIVEWRAFWVTVLRNQMLPEVKDDAPVNCLEVAQNFYETEYAQAVSSRAASGEGVVFQNPGPNLYVYSMKLSRSEELLKRIWRFSRRPVGAVLISIVPFKIQRSIKRYLSHRPMHDIVGRSHT